MEGPDPPTTPKGGLEPGAAPPAVEPPPPRVEGFRTIERIGSGGAGEVWKLEDLTLRRMVAAKVLRPDPAGHHGLAEFLREATAQALFSDPRIARVYEFRTDSEPPVLLMEYVEGFALGRIAPSLEYPQRARILAEVAEAIHGAHRKGIQHRDLKPQNILLDEKLCPRILDFGLSGVDPDRGHFVGTVPYMAPEQFHPGRRIDARTDVYALGVILYEMLCGALPYTGESIPAVLEKILEGKPRLPVEVQPEVPEPLQAIALKAMAPRPEDRYANAREMALDLERFLHGRPVLARPAIYGSALERKVRPHLTEIAEWLRLRLIYPHEADRLRTVYRTLEAREDDWIVHGRILTLSQISLYIGAFLLALGGGLYFWDHRYHGTVTGLLGPAILFLVPFLVLNASGLRLERDENKAVAVAFYLAAALLLPLFLLVFFHEAGLWVVPDDTRGQFFSDGSVSNRQLQVAALAGCAWAFFLARRTRTMAMSAIFTALLLPLTLAIATDLGLREWLEEEKWDILAVHLVPLLLAYWLLALVFERRRMPWLPPSLHVGSAVLLVAILEMLALDGKAFAHLGLSMQALQSGDVSDPTLLDTLTAMSASGIVFYVAASLLSSKGSDLARPATFLLFTICPFAILEPVAYLNETEDYARGFLWSYLALSLAITYASHLRQRKSFYYAGLLNTAIALGFISDRYEWWDRPWWAVVVVVTGLAVLGLGLRLHLFERSRRTAP